MATAQDIMETDILTAQQSERVSSVVYNMAVNDVGAALVVDKNRLVSIFTERDLLKRVIAEERTFEEVLVEEVATDSPICVRVDTSLKECASILQEKNFRHLPVVNDDHEPVGIISTRDFFRRLTIMFAESNQDPYQGLAAAKV